ncbi:MAG TPA: Ig-like domain-containing protein, partial [Pyrinomonadaceae bacterium]|nr:Ig-like domain-containing protein [Pyrinomonadaceae bacterium]
MFAINRSFLIVIFLALCAISVLAQGTNSSTTTSAVKTVQVSAPVKEAEVGQQIKVTAVAKDAAGNVINEQPSTFFAGPFDIAAVDDDGNVKLFGTGEVTVGAIIGGKPGLTTFMVKAPSIKTIDVTPLKTPLIVGGSIPLDAVTRIYNGDPRTGVPINWTTYNPRVATVDAGGVVTGVGPGKATITATSGTATSTTQITVVKNTLRSLLVSATSKTARTGDVIRFNAKGTPASDVATRWSVSGTGATIDTDGAFVADKPG